MSRRPSLAPPRVTATIDSDRLELIEFSITQDEIEVATFGGDSEPDSGWRFTDAAGHFHAYVPDTQHGRLRVPELRTPTLVSRETRPAWCETCRERHGDSYLACVLCGERIEPGRRVVSRAPTIPGQSHATARAWGDPPPAAHGPEHSVVIAEGDGVLFGLMRVSSVQFGSSSADRQFKLAGWLERAAGGGL